jgi:hypothetical protein
MWLRTTRYPIKSTGDFEQRSETACRAIGLPAESRIHQQSIPVTFEVFVNPGRPLPQCLGRKAHIHAVAKYAECSFPTN